MNQWFKRLMSNTKILVSSEELSPCVVSLFAVLNGQRVHLVFSHLLYRMKFEAV